MADNSVQKSLKINDKSKYNNVINKTTSESLRLSDPDKGVTHPTSLQTPHNPRKISSFQITSVTVGSRVSTDAGEDSADDLDESHTDELSRVTDFENETPSFSEDTFSKDDVFYNAVASVGCAPVIPTSSQYGLAIVGQEGGNQQGTAGLNNSEQSDVHVSVTSSGTGSIINIIGNSKPQEGMKDNQEHMRNERFKVVKIESTEPFRRGRWTCMDYLDHSNPQTNTTTITNSNLEDGVILQAPDSGIMISENQTDELVSSMEILKQSNQINAALQADPNVQKNFSMVSPGQSLTQPVNLVQQSVPVQSPPLELPQKISSQTIQSNQQASQQHPQSMTHINLQNQPNSHTSTTQPQNIQQIPQSFPQHQLQQVIAQTQGLPQLQTMPIHQQMPQQLQHLPNQAIQQITSQHLTQGQPSLTNLSQIPQQLGGMQTMSAQPQMQQVPNVMQQIQGQGGQPQLHQIQQPQLGLAQQTQLQHMNNPPQIQALQGQQLSNHLQQMQMSNQLNPTQQISQMQAQLTGQQQVVSGMHPQIQQGNIAQYNQSVNQQSNPQGMLGGGIQSSQQPMVSTTHSVNYHTQQSQMSQPGQSLAQDVLNTIATSQGSSVAANLQAIPSQPQGSTLPANVQGIAPQQQNIMHSMSQPGQSLPQGAIQMINQTPQSMSLSMDSNQTGMQIPVSDTIYMQQSNVNAQLPMTHNLPQAQNMMQQVSSQGQSQQHLAQSNQHLPQQNQQHMSQPGQQHMSQPIQQHMSQSNQQHLAQQPQQHMSQQSQPHLAQQTQQHLPQQNQQHLPQQNQQHITQQHINQQNQQHINQQNQQHMNQQNQSHLAQQNQQHMPQQNQQHLPQQNQQHLPQQNQQHLAQHNQINMQYVLSQQQNLQSNQPVPQSQQQNSVQQISQPLPQVAMPNPQTAQPIMQNMTVQHSQNMQMQNISATMQGTSVHNVPTNVVQSQTNAQASMPAQVNMSIGNYQPQGLPQKILPVMSQTNINNNQAIEVNQSVATSQSILSGTNSPVVTLPSLYPGGQSVVADGQSYSSPVSVVNNMVNSSDVVCVQDGIHGETSAVTGDINDGKDDGHQQTNAVEDESFSGLAMALGGGVGSGAGSPSSAVSATNEPPEPQSSRAASPGPAGDRAAHHASASGTSAVAIDNKIEQAMDLVKSHLMFAVREEVEVLKERIAELMERITQLELENSYLRMHASQDTLAQLPVAPPKAAPQTQPNAAGPIS